MKKPKTFRLSVWVLICSLLLGTSNIPLASVHAAEPQETPSITANDPQSSTNTTSTQSVTVNVYFTPITEDQFESPGQTASTLYGPGIGITEVDNTNGQWQYYHPDLHVWYAIDSPNTISVFGANIGIRFVPKANWNGTAQFKYRDWTLDIAPGYPNWLDLNKDYASLTTHFGNEVKTAEITVTPVNDMPFVTETGGTFHYELDGKSYATYPDLGIYSKSFTYEGWLYPTSAPTWGRFFDTSYGYDNFNVFLGFEGNTGRVSFAALPQIGPRAIEYKVITNERLPLNQWVHVSMVYDDTLKKVHIYWNGVLKASGTADMSKMEPASSQNGGGPRPINLMGESTWTQDANYTGGMRDVRFWSKARTQDQIRNEMGIRLNGTESGLAANYHFSDPTDGTVAKDYSNAARNGDIVQGFWKSSDGFNRGVKTTVNTPATKTFTANDVDGDEIDVIVSSSNPTLIPTGNISVVGHGSERQLILTPNPDQSGTSQITVTLNDGQGLPNSTSSATFQFTVIPGDYDLTSIKPSVGTMEPAFNQAVASYKIHLPGKTNNSPTQSVDIDVVAANPGEVVVTAQADNGSGLTVTGSYPTFTVTGLKPGVTQSVKIRVADKNGAGGKDYQLELIRYPGNDAGLSASNGLALFDGNTPIALKPTYSNDTPNYTAEVEQNVSKITVNVEKSAAASTVELNGSPIGSSNSTTANGTVELKPGRNVIDVKVIAEDGKTVKSYSVTLIRKLSADARLVKLTTGPSGLSPVFVSDKSEYTLNVPYDETTATFTPTAVQHAKIEINGVEHESSEIFTTPTLNSGSNIFNIKVTAQDGVTTRTYSLVIVKAPSDVADLTTLTVTPGTLSPAFDNTNTAYSVTLPNADDEIDITPTLSDSTATITIDGDVHTDGTAYTKPLAVGINTVTIQVTSESLNTKKTTIITIIREASSNADLESLDVDGETLSPAFDRNQTDYEITVDSSTDELDFLPKADDDAYAEVLLNGILVNAGDKKTVTLKTGVNTITITVKAQDGKTTKTYTVTVVRKASSNADLKNIFVDTDPLANFDSATSEVFTDVPNTVSAILVGAATVDPTATYKVNGQPAAPLLIDLAVGNNKVEFVTLAQDGQTTKTYTLNIIRAASGNANLDELLLKDGDEAPIDIEPEFSPDVFIYDVTIEDTTETVKLGLQPEDENAEITVTQNGIPVPSPYILTPTTGLNIIEIDVTAQDGSKKRYTLNLIKNPSADATLKQLIVDAELQEPIPVFSPGTREYAYHVSNKVDTFSLQPKANADGATYQVTQDGQPIDPSNLELKEGNNTFTVTVTAADGITTLAYTVNIYREILPKDASLSSLQVISARGTESLSPTFPSDERTYEVQLPYSSSKVTVEALANDPLAKVTLNGLAIDGSQEVGLLEGNNVFEIRVLAQDGKTQQVHALTIVRQPAAAPSPNPIPVPVPVPIPIPVPVPAPTPTPTPIKESVTIRVETGELNQGPLLTQIPIDRTRQGDSVRDVITLSEAYSAEAIAKLAESGNKTARVVVPDDQDEVTDQRFNVDKTAVQALGGAGVALELFTENVKIIVPQGSMNQFDGDLYFRLIPIKKESERIAVENRAKVEKIVREVAQDDRITVVGRPMTIETNMQSRAVTLVLPLTGVTLPNNPVEREAFLADLAIFIEHSDGEKALIRAKVVDYKPGLKGLEFGVNKFSTFTVLDMNGADLESLLGPINTADGSGADGNGSGSANFHEAYINGFTDGTFKPERTISRAEMAAILARNLGYSENIAPAAYPDVQATHWAAAEIAFVQSVGLMVGDDRGLFRPNAPISRGEMATIASRYKKLAVTDSASGFQDTIGHWAAKEIEAARAAGILNGYTDGTYRPNGRLTRSEAVKIVNRIFDRGPLYGTSKPSWPDVPSSHWAYEEIEEASRNHSFALRPEGGENFQP
ncbi:cadherin-like beta sandwich domain-containing protein [Saccharibacillus sacchari]|uniref:cadherin-like beta sandwich domain-containing protein n=1 Tax=Saccharibacillus sacchari TaxID=456493 RepID=UPI000A02CE00|nr:cadherin-like beta sandwich domain-containing protein [Saccharibacillus sacchari]